MTIQATITLTFTVVDEARLRNLATAAIDTHGGGHDTDGTAADMIVELLLHSNPDIGAYLDYGIELIRTDTADQILPDEGSDRPAADEAAVQGVLASLGDSPTPGLLAAHADHPDPRVRDKVTRIVTDAAVDGRRLRVRFTPQAWMNDHAVEVDAEGPVEWDASPVGIDALQSSGNPDLSDALAYEPWFTDDPATPAWIRAWTGPFHIEVLDTNLPRLSAP